MSFRILKRVLANPIFLSVFLFCCLAFLVVLRRPDALLNPQFWAEDGSIWYADAYNKGLIALFTPQQGYMQTLPKLVAVLSLLFPLSFAPLIFNIVAIGVQTLPLYLITTKRFQQLVPSKLVRLLLILMYWLMPNVGELYINLTNAYWYLAVSAFIVLSFPDVSKKIKIGDILIILFSGLTGPLSIFLFVIFGVSDYLSKKKLELYTKVLGVTAVIQVLALIFSKNSDRIFVPVDNTFHFLSQIIIRQIVWGSLAGKIGQESIEKYFASYAQSFYYFTLILAVILAVFALWKGSKILRQFIVFGLITFASSLVIHIPWEVLITTYEVRYWLIPMLAFLSCVVGSVYDKNPRLIRLIGFCFIFIFFFFVFKNYRQYHNFRYGPYQDFQFQEYAKQFEELPPGEMFSIPINPSGWQVVLIKQ